MRNFRVDLRTGEIRTAVVFANRADIQEQYNLKVCSLSLLECDDLLFVVLLHMYHVPDITLSSLKPLFSINNL